MSEQSTSNKGLAGERSHRAEVSSYMPVAAGPTSSGGLSFVVPITSLPFPPPKISDSGAPSWINQVSFGRAGPLLGFSAPCPSRMTVGDGANASLKSRPEPTVWRRVTAPGQPVPIQVVPPRAWANFSPGRVGPLLNSNGPESQ